MRWYHHYVAYFFGGAFLANFVPHFVAGVSGSPFQSPFASPPGEGLSSATVNVAWGSFNLFIAYLLLLRVGKFDLKRWSHVGVFAAGFVLMALMAARALARVSPAMTFIYRSGAGTDDSERGRAMWARVKGQTENALKQLPFRAAVMFRPGIIQPLHGIRSRTRIYRVLYVIMTPLF